MPERTPPARASAPNWLSVDAIAALTAAALVLLIVAGILPLPG